MDGFRHQKYINRSNNARFNENFANAHKYKLYLHANRSLSVQIALINKLASRAVGPYEHEDSSPRESHPSLPSLLHDVNATQEMYHTNRMEDTRQMNV